MPCSFWRPAGDELHGALEHDLEAGQLLVAEVLALVVQAAGLGLGVVDDLAGPGLGRLDDLGALHHALGAGAGRVEDLVALVAHLGEVLLALLEQPAGGPELVGQPLDGLVEQLEDLLLVIITDADSGIGRAASIDVADAAAGSPRSRRRGSCAPAPGACRQRRPSSSRSFGAVAHVIGVLLLEPLGDRRRDHRPRRRRRSGRSRGCSFDARNEWADADGMNTVCDPGDGLVHLGHLQLGLEVGHGAQALDDEVGADLAGQVDDQAENIVTSTLSRCATTLVRSCASRSSRSNSGSPFCGLRMAATMTPSNSRDAVSMISRWPLWIGSNDPG